MFPRLDYGDNYLEVADFCFYKEEAEKGNPYNTIFSLVVQSRGFRGVAPCEYDIKEFQSFVTDLNRLYYFEIDEVCLKDICYGSNIRFSMNQTGHMEISGKIYGDAMIHALEFCFDADQTSLKSFLDGLNEWMCKRYAYS